MMKDFGADSGSKATPEAASASSPIGYDTGERRDAIIAEARAIGDALSRAYQDRVALAVRSGSREEIEIVRLNFETDYRRATNHLVYLLGALPFVALAIPTQRAETVKQGSVHG